MLNPFRIIDMFRSEEPEKPVVYRSHRAWAGVQSFSTEGIMNLAYVAMNPIVHHCRIGKITLKSGSPSC